MTYTIDGFIEVKAKGPYERWRYVEDINVESQDSPFWCYLFGFNCGKYDNRPEDHKGIFDDNRIYYTINGQNDDDLSFHLIGMFIEEEFYNSFGPYYITIDDIDKIDYNQLNRKPGPDYEEIFNRMKEIKKNNNEVDVDVRLICWFD